MTLSCLILTKNNERTIRYTLESVRSYADEIVILDSGSTDRTLTIASEYGAKVYTRALDSFSEQRNYGMSKCSCDYIFLLDSDELIGENFAQLLSYLDYGYQTLSLPRYNIISVEPMEYLITLHHYRNWQNRIIKNNKRSKGGSVHEKLVDYRPRLHFAFAHIFHLDYLCHSYPERKRKVAFYNSIQDGTGFPEYYLFEDYPYCTGKTLERLPEHLMRMLHDDMMLQRNQYGLRHTAWGQFQQRGRWELYKLLTTARATLFRLSGTSSGSE